MGYGDSTGLDVSFGEVLVDCLTKWSLIHVSWVYNGVHLRTWLHYASLQFNRSNCLKFEYLMFHTSDLAGVFALSSIATWT